MATLRSDIERLMRENAAMRAALLWYSVQDNWRRRHTNPKGKPPRRWKPSPATLDRGALANRTLDAIDQAREREDAPQARLLARLRARFHRQRAALPRPTVPSPIDTPET